MGRGWLLERFRIFVAELSALRAGFLPSGNQMEGDPVQRAIHHLTALLARDAAEARRAEGEQGEGMCREAQYVMVALADEWLSHDPAWADGEGWGTGLLEARLFGTCEAGERIFERMDRLLERRDPQDAPLAVLFLLTLKLGFLGRYRGEQGAGAAIDLYRRRLHNFIAGRVPDLSRSERPLCPDAYAFRLERKESPFLPNVWRWPAALASFLLAWLMIGHYAWSSAVSPVKVILAGVG